MQLEEEFLSSRLSNLRSDLFNYDFCLIYRKTNLNCLCLWYSTNGESVRVSGIFVFDKTTLLDSVVREDFRKNLEGVGLVIETTYQELSANNYFIAKKKKINILMKINVKFCVQVESIISFSVVVLVAAS